MYDAYVKCFDRMRIDYKVVTADTGIMGGLLSEEFQAVTDIGEDVLVLCDSCDYASNIEVSECVFKEEKNNEEIKELKEVHTPNVGKIKDLVDKYNIKTEDMTKSMIYKIDDEFVLVMVRSNDDINEIKLQKLFDAKEVILAEEKDVKRITGAEIGFAGPINLDIKIVADNALKNMKNFLVGANKTDYHYINANINRDFKVDIYADIKNVKEKDICPKCGGNIYFKKGIEVGNTFKLGTKYSEKLGLTYLDESNKLQPVVMGSYGIGLGRCMGAIVEQNNDEKGIIWSYDLAPYKVCIVPATDDSMQIDKAEEIYNKLKEKGIDVLLDDRDERLGVKLNDMDLIGIPVRILVGKKINENIVEFKLRNSDIVEEITINEAINRID
jgi:prolyl-tRNA synthetase